MRKLPLVGEHGVLVRTKRLEASGDEFVQPRDCLLASHRPGAVRTAAPHLIAERCNEIADLGVNVVRFEVGDRWPRTSVLRWLLAVVVIEVPLSTDGRHAVHEDSEPFALPSIEVLHLEPLAPLSPLFEFAVVAEELVVRKHLNTPTCLQASEQRGHVPAHRFHHDEPINIEFGTVLAISLHEARRASQVDIEAFVSELLCEMSHR